LVLDVNSLSMPAPIKFDEEGLQREVTPGLVVGRLMTLVSEELEAAKYIRYEPRFITNSEVDAAAEPLMVRFPGRGVDLFLEVSPLPQLLYAAVMTCEPKLYSPTRLFSRAYRDGFTSAASPIVAAVEIESGNPITPLEELTRLLVSGFNKAQDRGLPVDPVPEDRIVVVDNNDSTTEQTEAIRIRIRHLASPAKSAYAYDVRTLFDVVTPSGLILVEGHQGCIADALPYNWTCVHIERLAAGDFWRIRQRRGPESGAHHDA